MENCLPPFLDHDWWWISQGAYWWCRNCHQRQTDNPANLDEGSLIGTWLPEDGKPLVGERSLLGNLKNNH